jgi:bacteriocin biosynthesis cyclodehydratase domain-containing protein
MNSIRPSLKQDAVFLRSQHGVFVRHREDSFVIRGQSAFQLLSALAPRMTGEQTLSELCDGLTEGQKSSVESLVSMLTARGLVIDHEVPAEGVDVQALQTFAGQVSFLEHFGDRGGRGFDRFRNAAILVVGDQTLAGSVVKSLQSNGSSRVRLLRPIDLELNSSAGSAAVDLQQAELVCFASLTPDPQIGVRLAETCEASNVAYLPAWRLGTELILGPLATNGRETGPSSHDPACWRCLWLRMQDNTIAGAADFWAGVTLGPSAMRPVSVVPDYAGAIAGGLLAFEIFKYLSGALRSELQDALVVLNLEHCTTSRHRPLLHPCCERGRQWPAAPPTKPSAANTYVARRTGIFTAFGDDSLPQIPIATAAVEAPVLPPAFTSEGVIYGFAASALSEARADALHRALENYALYTLRRTKRLPSEAGAKADDNGRLPPTLVFEELTTWLGTRGRSSNHELDAVPASTLDGSKAYRVPLSAVVASPALDGVAEFEPCADGVAAAATLADAVSRALTGAAGLIDLDGLARGQRAVAAVPASELEADDRGRFYLAAADILDCPVEVYQVLTNGPVCTALLVLGGSFGGRIVARAGRSWSDALERAFLHVCGWAQLIRAGVRADHPRDSPLLETLRWSTVPILPGDPGRCAAGPASEDQIVGYLHAAGLEPLVTDITPSDVAQLKAAYIVRVLLRRIPLKTSFSGDA